VSHEKSEETRGDWLRRHGHLLVYALAIGVGFGLGARGLFGSGRLSAAASSTPLARVGYALTARPADADAGAWARLRADVDSVRAGMKPDEQPVFELVVAVHGLKNGGKAGLDAAERACRKLRWSRCDRAALAALATWSRP
jgi:hypothetical protein